MQSLWAFLSFAGRKTGGKGSSRSTHEAAAAGGELRKEETESRLPQLIPATVPGLFLYMYTAFSNKTVDMQPIWSHNYIKFKESID